MAQPVDLGPTGEQSIRGSYTPRIGKTSAQEIERFWDERAREDAYFFVDNRLRYREPDLETFWANGEQDLQLMLEAVGERLQRQDDAVEIGCGLGRLTRPLSAQVHHVAALDVSSEMLARARKLNLDLHNVTWTHGDGQTLRPLPDSSADLCVSHVVFQHLPDPTITLAYVREMGRILRPGGRAVFVISNDHEVHRPIVWQGLSRLRHRLKVRIGRAPGGQQNRAWLGSAVDLADLTSAAHAASLEVADVQNAGTQYCVVKLTRTSV